MKPIDFARVCDSIRPLLWAAAVVIVILAGVYAVRQMGKAEPATEASSLEAGRKGAPLR